MSSKNFTVTFDITVNTTNCDPDILDELEAHVQDGIMRLLDGKFPSGDCGPDQSITELNWPSLSIRDAAEDQDAEWSVCAECEEEYIVKAPANHACCAACLKREAEEELRDLEIEFENAGGRGVELAERIDALRLELGGEQQDED